MTLVNYNKTDFSLVNLNNKLTVTNKLLQLSDLDRIIWDDEKSGHFTDSRDFHTYKVVRIGKQIWMAENLSYIPHVSHPEKQGGIWVYDYFGNNVNEAKQTENYVKFGCLYDWEAAKIVCPVGWHIPSDKEWKILTKFLGGPNTAGGKIKSKTTDWKNPNSDATNETGFTALPAGSRGYDGGSFYSLGTNAGFWSSKSNENDNAWSRYLNYYNGELSRSRRYRTYGYSIRCTLD